jgi:integrase
MRDEVSQSQNSRRRWAVDTKAYPGLWARRKANGAVVYEVKLRQNGELRSKTLPSGTTKSQAVTEWKKRSSARDEGGMPIARNLRLADLAAQALADLDAKAQAGIRSERTHALYVGRWSNFIEPVLGRKTLSKLGPADILRLVARLRQDGHAEWTAHGIITVLRFVLRFARHAGYMVTDPFATIAPDDLPRQEARESFDARVLRPDEIERLLAKTTFSYRNVVTLIAFAGLRVSEAAGMTWADIDLVDGVVHVREQLAQPKRGEAPRRVKVKSRASRRTVPLVERASEALVAQLAESRRRVAGGSRTTCSAPPPAGPWIATASRRRASPERQSGRASGASPRRPCAAQPRLRRRTLASRSSSRRRSLVTARRSTTATTRGRSRMRRSGRWCAMRWLRSASETHRFTKRLTSNPERLSPRHG